MRKIGEHKPHYKPKLLTGKTKAGEKDIKVIYNANTRGPDPKKATPSSTWALTAIFLTLLLDLHHKSSKAKVKRHTLVELGHLACCYPQYYRQTQQLFPPSLLHAVTLLFTRLLVSVTTEPVWFSMAAAPFSSLTATSWVSVWVHDQQNAWLIVIRTPVLCRDIQNKNEISSLNVLAEVLQWNFKNHFLNLLLFKTFLTWWLDAWVMAYFYIKVKPLRLTHDAIHV